LCKLISLRHGGTPRLLTALLLLVLGSGAAICQESGPPPNGPADGMGPPPMEGRRPPMERAFHLGPHGRWWNNPDFVKKLSLTPDQQKKMEAVYEQSRPSLTDLLATVRKEETAMEPLLSADQPDEGKILAQIDHLAAARAELEKANARMLLGLRRVLTPDQWKTLQANEPHGHFPRFGPGGHGDYGSTPPPASAPN
jgi:periplasmic protein CpxP/Spy